MSTKSKENKILSKEQEKKIAFQKKKEAITKGSKEFDKIYLSIEKKVFPFYEKHNLEKNKNGYAQDALLQKFFIEYREMKDDFMFALNWNELDFLIEKFIKICKDYGFDYNERNFFTKEIWGLATLHFNKHINNKHIDWLFEHLAKNKKKKETKKEKLN